MNKEDKKKILFWTCKTTLICVLLVSVCFAVILGIMFKSYDSSTNIEESINGTWKCVQFYKNQKSFLVPDNQEIVISIEGGSVKMYGSGNASILRGERGGTYTIEGGNIMVITMGEDTLSCPCVFTNDGLLRLTIPEMEVVLYLERRADTP